MDPAFQHLKSGDRVDAAQLTRLGKSMERQSAGNASAGLDQFGGPAGPLTRPSTPPFLWIKITGISGTAYAWTAETFSAGTPSDRIPTIAGTTSLFPAYEVTGSISVPTDGSAIVQAWLSDDGTSYLFEENASGGGGTLEVTDGTTTVMNVTELDFTSGATVTNGGAGIADVAIRAAGNITTVPFSSVSVSASVVTVATFTAATGGYLIVGNLNAISASASDTAVQLFISKVSSILATDSFAISSTGALTNGTACLVYMANLTSGDVMNLQVNLQTGVTGTVSGNFIYIKLY